VTSPNDVISDKLVISRDNETDSETEIKKGIRGQTGTWSLKDKRDVFFLFCFVFLWFVFHHSSPKSLEPFITV